MDSATGLRKLLHRHGIGVGTTEWDSFLAYLRLLEKWNARTNLTASTDWNALGWLFEEALWAAQFYPIGPTVHLDLGSGAGFPALLLRLLRPGMRLRLVEGRSRRAAFLETAAAELRLEGTEVFAGRIEDYLQRQGTQPFDVVSWKAVRLGKEAFKALVAWSAPEARFWMFHGSELPLKDPARAASCLRLLQREAFAGHPGSYLSIFRVSRETSQGNASKIP